MLVASMPERRSVVRAPRPVGSERLRRTDRQRHVRPRPTIVLPS